jgi:hypothetical protein
MLNIVNTFPSCDSKLMFDRQFVDDRLNQMLRSLEIVKKDKNPSWRGENMMKPLHNVELYVMVNKFEFISHVEVSRHSIGLMH